METFSNNNTVWGLFDRYALIRIEISTFSYGRALPYLLSLEDGVYDNKIRFYNDDGVFCCCIRNENGKYIEINEKTKGRNIVKLIVPIINSNDIKNDIKNKPIPNTKLCLIDNIVVDEDGDLCVLRTSVNVGGGHLDFWSLDKAVNSKNQLYPYTVLGVYEWQAR